MLRVQRLVSIRSSRSLLSTQTRFASAATQFSARPTSAFSVDKPQAPPEPLQRNRLPLYTVPPLPPLAPPLPADATHDSHETNSTNSSAISASQEQLAVLNACLASGDTQRAEEVAKRIRSTWLKSGADVPLSTLLPARVHADFLRAYLASSLVPTLPTSATIGLSLSSTSSATRSRLVAKAWTYFDSLSSEQWETADSKGRVKNLALDSAVFAVMFKGLTAAGAATYHPSTVTDPEQWLRPITTLLPALAQRGIALQDVLKDPIFWVELPSYLGKVTPDQVLDALESTGRGRGGWSEWENVIADCRQQAKIELEGRKQELAKTLTAELTPTNSVGEQINVSLATLRTNLSTLSMPDGVIAPSARQRLLEESSYDAARQLYIHEMEELAKVGKDKERGMNSNWLQSVMFDWMKLLQRSLQDAAQQTGKASPWGKDPDIEPFLRLLSPDKMALITIVELLRLCGGGGVYDGMKAARAILHVGKSIENEYHAQILRETFPNKEFDRELERIAESQNTASTGKDAAEMMIQPSSERALGIMWRREMAKLEQAGDTSWRPSWTQPIRAKVGSILITALMEVAKVERTMRNPTTGETISEIQPAFSHAYQYVRGKKLGIIKVNTAVADRMDQDPLRITLHPRFLPMLVKPKPWLSWNSGSYLVHSTQIMRTKDSIEQTRYLKQASENDTLDQIFSGLDVLGQVPWKINRRVFDVISTVWNSGEALAEIPAKGSLTEPVEAEKPENMDTDPRARDTYRHRIRKALQEKRAAHSNRCDVNYKLEIGRAFLGETFYFPHNLDFRGRAYPIPPNLSHIGDDMCRGILMFAEKKPLGERGLRWLKIHLANLSGYDKASFDEREAFAMQHLEEIYDSAENPLGGKRWWLTADDPWQALATCIELTEALRSRDPTAYECGLPIHQDGTCNGLQHYAALGGDLKGANQVNLEAGDRPADVYSGVASMANDVIYRDAALGVAEALLLKGKVTRKVVKQTVMTTVYGVTFIGAKKQIEKQLKERGDIPAEHLYTCSLYLGRIVLESIGGVFKGATAIQTWLNRCARLISKSIPPNRIEQALQAQQIKSAANKKPSSSTSTAKRRRPELAALSRIPKEQMTSVVWTTPLGLPVVQPYRKPKKSQVSTALQTIYITDPSIPSEVDPRAQATAFPPNFIHSLDATHMMMTALGCKDKIAFASVHDSYWTHANSVDEMSEILRDAFIELHSADILGKLRNEFIERYSNYLVPVSKVPKGLNFSQASAEGKLVSGEYATTTMTSETPVETADDVIHDLEQADGDQTLPLFAQSAATKRVKIRKNPRTTAEELDDEAESDYTENDGLADMWSSAKMSKTVDSKFVLLSDILPPVPEKGDFDLERIRQSLYFFS